MRYLVIYSFETQEAVAACTLDARGEYEMLNHRFNVTKYWYNDIGKAEFETMTEAFEALPVKNLLDFCVPRRFEADTGIEY